MTSHRAFCYLLGPCRYDSTFSVSSCLPCRLSVGRGGTSLYSTSSSDSMRASMLNAFKSANSKYEAFLKRRFPNFYKIYSSFLKGVRAFILDAKTMHETKTRLREKNGDVMQMSYREMEKMRQFHRDLKKAVPLMMISVPPFANYAVIMLMYFYPRQFLTPHFWTQEQERDFLKEYHQIRAEYYENLLRQTVEPWKDEKPHAVSRVCKKVLDGHHPSVRELLEIFPCFTQPPLYFCRTPATQLRTLSRVMQLTPHLPAPLLRHRLSRHSLELRQLDILLARLGIKNLTDLELRKACFLRGLNSMVFTSSACRLWLQNWLNLTTTLKGPNETLPLVYSMVLLSMNFHER
uniref:LETM1 domain-containing protein 1 isoform X1 n=1 Tax=Myxine glutinosa TaxID=7769 RepID=UPI00358FFA5B